MRKVQDLIDKQNLNSKEELVQRKDVKDTPFTIISTKEEGSFAVMGKYRITEPYETVTEAEKEAKKITWNRLIQVMMLVSENMNERNEQLEKILKDEN